MGLYIYRAPCTLAFLTIKAISWQQLMRVLAVEQSYLIAQGSHCLHAKENPELPGMEYAVGTLRRQLIGHGAPYTELFKCQTATGEVYPLQLAKTVPGENFHTFLRLAESEIKEPKKNLQPSTCRHSGR